MAKSLIEKLNLLVRSGVSDFMTEVGERLPDISFDRSREFDFEVESLRQRINEALAYEDRLDADLQKLLIGIEETDLAVDQAVAAGDDARARMLVQRLKRMQQRAAMLESQLQQHRAAAAGLISQVNYLDSLVGDIEQRRRVEKEIGRELSQTQPPPSAGPVEAPPPPPARAEPRRQPPPPAEVPPKPKTVRIPVSAGEDAPAHLQAAAEQRPARAGESVAPASTTPAVEAAASPALAVQETPPTGEPASVAEDQPERYRLPPALAGETAPPPNAEVDAPAKPQLPEMQRLTEALRKAREQAEQAEQKMDTAQAWKTEMEGQQPPWPDIPDEGPTKDEVDADLAARRSRLSKPE